MHISEYWKESLVYNITSSPWKYVTRATHTPGNAFIQHDWILLLFKQGPGFWVDWTSLCPGFLGGGFVGVIFYRQCFRNKRFMFDEKIFFYRTQTYVVSSQCFHSKYQHFWFPHDSIQLYFQLYLHERSWLDIQRCLLCFQ